MMQSEGELDLLQEGIARARKGAKAEALVIFEKLAAAEPNHETVWLWLSSVAPDAEASARYLEKALRVDPSNRQARHWLERLRGKSRPRTSAWQCPLCNQSFTAKPTHCARCRADLDLEKFEVFMNPRAADLDVELIEQTVRETLADRELEAARRHRILALGYLNLRRYQKALSQLGALAALVPDDVSVSVALEALTRYLEEAARARVAPPREVQESNVATAPIDPQILREAVAAANVRKPRVLVVDDSPTVRSVLNQTLERGGYDTLLASNGMEALARLQEAIPDLVLLDVTMPHLDGFKICRVIKESDLTAHVPVIFLTGKDGFLDKVKGRMAGAADYLTKPVSTKKLLKTVERHCDRWISDDS